MSDIESELFRDDDGRQFLKLFDEKAGVHVMIEIDDNDVTSLARTLLSPPAYIDGRRYGSDDE